MPDTIHVVLHRDDVYGSFATSPQVPGLIVGRPTWDSLLQVVDAEFDAVGAPGHRVWHEQRSVRGADGRTVSVRFVRDDDATRRDLARVLIEALQLDRAYLDTVPSDIEDVVLFIACVRSDAVHWLIDQVDPTGSAFSAAVFDDDARGYIARQFVSGDQGEGEFGITVEDVADWTIGQLLDSGATYDPTTGQLVEPPRTAAAADLFASSKQLTSKRPVLVF